MKCQDRDAWDNDYSTRGPVWSGAVPVLPALPPSSRVLEFGCGNGKTLAGMLHSGWKITATDFSREAVVLSRQVTGSVSPCEFTVSDVRCLPFRPDSFDAVFAYHVLGHMNLNDRIVCIRETERILRPRGRIFFSEFSVEDFRFGKGTGTEPGTFMRGNGIPTHYFTREEVCEHFSAFRTESLVDRRWKMRIRGNDLPRSEIHAVFLKQDS